jgi:hypothetical protein
VIFGSEPVSTLVKEDRRVVETNNVALTRIEPTTNAKDARDYEVGMYYPNGTVIRLKSNDGQAFDGIFICEKGKLEIAQLRLVLGDHFPLLVRFA